MIRTSNESPRQEFARTNRCAAPRLGRRPVAHHRPDRVPHGRRSLRDAGDPAVARRAPTTCRRPPWASRSTRARSAWRSRAWRSRIFSRRIDRRVGILASLVAAVGADGAACRGARSCDVHRAAHHAGRVHGDGLHADAVLPRRSVHGARRPRARSPRTSPATSRATSSAACCPPRSPITWGWPATSTSSRR